MRRQCALTRGDPSETICSREILHKLTLVTFMTTLEVERGTGEPAAEQRPRRGRRAEHRRCVVAVQARACVRAGKLCSAVTQGSRE